jgi:replicative DNA helicase
MTVDELDAHTIEQRVASMRAGGSQLEAAGGGEAASASPRRRYVHPLRESADSLIEALRVPDGIGLGLAAIDVLTRGFRPSDLVIVTGFAHSAKTQLVNTMLVLNPDKRVLFFSLDDPAEMILAKLVAMSQGVSSDVIERKVREGDRDTMDLIRTCASQDFPNLLVVDEVIGLNAMQVAVAEATELWGAGPDAVVVDYLEMMPGAHMDDLLASVKQKANAMKAWAKSAAFPVICLHQGTRTNSKPGEPITITSMGHSGEQQATIVIGTRRKREKADLDPFDRRIIEDTVTLHVVKNKRPGGRITSYEGIDFHLSPQTGMISPLDHAAAQIAANPQSAAARKTTIEQQELA